MEITYPRAGELRSFAFRAGKSGRKITGYAAKFGRPATLKLGFIETIRPGAFRDCLTQDVRCLQDHSPNLLLGRTTNGTLSLAEDSVGLRFSCDVAQTSYGDDLLALIERGDLTGCSFGFVVAPDGDKWGTAKVNGRTVSTREITRVQELIDVSVCAYPAYDSTEVARDLPLDALLASEEEDPFGINADSEDEYDSLRSIDGVDGLFPARVAAMFPGGVHTQELRSALMSSSARRQVQDELRRHADRVRARKGFISSLL